jgi:hypothetical protein
MSEYVTDPELLKKLGGSSDEYVNDPELLKKLNAGSTVDESDLVQKGVQAALPAITGANTPTGLAQLSDEAIKAVKPVASAVVDPIKQMYQARPLLSAAADIAGLATTGVPLASSASGILTGLEGLSKKYQGLQEGLNSAQKFLSKGELVTNPATGTVSPATVPEFQNMKKLAPEMANQLSNIWHKQGGNAGVQAFLKSAEGQAALAANPELAKMAEQYMGKVPGLATQAMRVAGPVLRGAARVAGPVGLGMNMYDAGSYAQESGLGQRLAQGQGQQAEQAFRGMTNQNVSGYQPTPQEASNIMESQDQRIIKMYGGPDRLRELIRAKAAVKALGL